MAFYSKRHYTRLANGGPDTPENVSERIAYRVAAERAIADRERQYPTLTAENAGAAMRYQEERIKHHLNNKEQA